MGASDYTLVAHVKQVLQLAPWRWVFLPNFRKHEKYARTFFLRNYETSVVEAWQDLPALSASSSGPARMSTVLGGGGSSYSMASSVVFGGERGGDHPIGNAGAAASSSTSVVVVTHDELTGALNADSGTEHVPQSATTRRACFALYASEMCAWLEHIVLPAARLAFSQATPGKANRFVATLQRHFQTWKNLRAHHTSFSGSATEAGAATTSLAGMEAGGW